MEKRVGEKEAVFIREAPMPPVAQVGNLLYRRLAVGWQLEARLEDSRINNPPSLGALCAVAPKRSEGASITVVTKQRQVCLTGHASIA